MENTGEGRKGEDHLSSHEALGDFGINNRNMFGHNQRDLHQLASSVSCTLLHTLQIIQLRIAEPCPLARRYTKWTISCKFLGVDETMYGRQPRGKKGGTVATIHRPVSPPVSASM